MYRWVILSLMFMTIIGANATIAQETPKDAAIVVAVSGAVTYQSQSTQTSPVPVQPFMKMYQDDVLTLPAESQIKLLYPKGGRKESWSGPVALRLGEKDSQVQGAVGVQPQVENLPKIARTVRETNLPLIERGGVTIVRAGESQESGLSVPTPIPLELTDEELAEIEDARTAYSKMKEQAGPGDVTPDLYLLSMLAYYEQYQEMLPLITELLNTHPENEVLLQWEAWVKAQQAPSS